MLNRMYRGFAMLFVVVLATYFCGTVYCQSTPASIDYVDYLDARISVKGVEKEIKAKVDEVKEMVEIKEDIEAAIGQITKSGRMNALQAVAGRFKKSPVAVVMALAKQIDNTTTALDIVPSLETLQLQISEVINSEIDIGIYQRERTGYNAVWDRYIEAYGKLEGEELRRANRNALGYSDEKDRVDQLQKNKEPLPNPDLLTVKECNGVCGGFWHDAEKHKETCDGCGEDYYVCDDKEEDKHLIRYCGKEIWIYDLSWSKRVLGICGAKYRKCDDSKKGVHHYYPVVAHNSYTNKYYFKEYKADTSFYDTQHGKGTKQPPAVSIYGPNGVGFPDDAFDNSPKCDTCICGGNGCPDAGQNHPKTVPDPPNHFSVSRTYYKGQIRLIWTKSASDGGSEIKDYQYQLSYYKKSSDSWTDWPSSWESAGTDSTMNTVISGLRSKTKYRVRMRAENDEGQSVETGEKTVTTR